MMYHEFLNFNPIDKNNLINLVRNINQIIETNDSTAASADHWSLCDDKNGEFVTFIDYDTFTKDVNLPMKLTMSDIYTQLPEIKNVFKKYNLYNYIGKVKKGNWGVHKHTYSPDTQWNLCFIDNVPEDTYIQFHKKTNGDEKPLSIDYIYDHLGNSESTLIEKIKVKSGDILALNVWQWHSFVVPHGLNTDVYFFYMKNMMSYEDIKNFKDMKV